MDHFLQLFVICRERKERYWYWIGLGVVGVGWCMALPENESSITFNMSTYEISDSQVSVHLCTFEGYFQRAKVNLRFPSLFFVEWKSMNAKNSVGMIGRKRAVNSQIDLDETLAFTTEMIYHKGQGKYLKKQSLIHLNLISNSRPDQAKLVGRIALDLSDIANANTYFDLRTVKLMYCSVEADLTFRVSMVRSIESNMHLNELDRSAFSDLYAFTGPKSGYKPKLQFKDSASERRVEQQKKKIKTRLSEKEEVASKNGRASSGKGQKILIQEHQQMIMENAMANSLPLTQKKQQQKKLSFNKIPENSPKVESNIPQKSLKRAETQAKLDSDFYKERNLLQNELNQHKNRVKKLQNDIMSAMKMFEQSKSESELNKTKYLESQNALVQLISRENKLKEECRQEIAVLKDGHQQSIGKVKEEYQKQIELVRSGYEADLKILRATMEEEKIRNEEKEDSAKKGLMEELEGLRGKIKEQEGAIAEMASLKEELQKMKTDLETVNNEKVQLFGEKKALDTELKIKIDQISSLQNQNYSLRFDLSELAKIGGQDMQLSFQKKIKELQEQIEKERAEKGQLSQKIEDLSSAFEEKITRIKEEMTARPSIPEQIIDTVEKTKESENLPHQPEHQNRDVIPHVEKVDSQPAPQTEAAVQTSQIPALQAKIAELTQIISRQETQLAESEQMVASVKLEYDLKMQELLSQLQTTQSQNQKLIAQITQNIKEGQPRSPFPPVDEDTMKLCEQLKQENEKITLELQNLKKNKDEEIDVLAKMTQQSEKVKSEVFIIEEQKKLQEVQIEQLKQERAALRETIEQLKEERCQPQEDVFGEEGINFREEVQRLKVVNKEVSIENEALKIELGEQKLKYQKDFADKTNTVGEQMKQVDPSPYQIETLPQGLSELPLEESPDPNGKQIENSKEILIQESPESNEKPNVLDSLRFETSVDELKNNPIKIENQNQTIQVSIDLFPRRNPSSSQQESPENPSFQVDHGARSRLNVNLNIDQKLQSEGQPSQRHNFNFCENLTHEDINQIGQTKNNEEEHVALKQQNMRLKQELEQIRSMRVIDAPETKQFKDQEGEKYQVKILMEEKKELEETIVKMKEEISRLSSQVNVSEGYPVSAPALPQPTSQIPSNTEDIEQYTKALASQRQANSSLTARIIDLQQLLATPPPSQRSYILIRDLQDKLSSLQQEMKIKDELLAESQRNIEQNYAVKYELADLKDKCNELKVALDERDVYVNELEEVKEYLSKQIYVLQQEKQERDAQKKQFEFRLEKVENSIDYSREIVDHKEVNELKNEIQALNQQLILLSNENQELKIKISEKDHQKQQIQNIVHEMQAKEVDLESKKGELQTKINELKEEIENRKQNVGHNSIAEEKPQQLCALCAGKDVKIQQKQNIIISLETQIKKLQYPCEHCQQKNEKIYILDLELTKTKEAQVDLNNKLEESNLHLAEFKKKMEELSAPKDVKSELSKLVQNMPNLQVHSIQSRSDAPALNYSQQDIPLDELGLRTPAVSSREDNSPAVTDRESPSPSPRESPLEESLKQQIQNLKKDVESKKQDIASLTYDLSQESEQKCMYFNEIEIYKQKIAELESSNKHLKEQGERFSALPLQSFDTNPKFGNGQRYHEIITQDHKEHEPSILKEVMVRAQAQQTPHRSSHSFDSPKQKTETQTRLQTNLTQISQQQLDFLKKQMDIVREQLSSEKKIHFELQQIHKICGKKYELLETRYQNCIEQLDYYQVENEDIMRAKNIVQEELYVLKQEISGQKEQYHVEGEENRKGEGLELEQQVIADPEERENVLMKAAESLSGVPLSIPQPKSKPLQPQHQPQQPQVDSTPESISLEQKLLQLSKSQQMFKSKALLLEANIQNLQKALQQQIQINQTNQKLSQKLQVLNELESMAEQFRLEREEIVKENQQLKRVKEQYLSLTADKGDLTQIIQEHALWSMEREQWGEKLTKIEEVLIQNQQKFKEEREELKQQVQLLQEKAALPQELPKTEQFSSEPAQTYQNEAISRQQQLNKQITLIRAQKLQQLQKVANLEQKVNKLQSQKTSKELELQQNLAIKQNEIQEMRFAIEQLQRELQENKVYLNQISYQQQGAVGEFNQLQESYNQVSQQLQQRNQELEGYFMKVKQMESQLQSMKMVVKGMEDEKAQGSAMDQLSSEVDKLQVEIAIKIQYIQELQARNGEIQLKLKEIQPLLQEKQEKMKVLGSIQQEKQQLNHEHQTLAKKLEEVQAELISVQAQVETIEKDKLRLGSTSEQKEKYAETLKTELSSKNEEITSLLSHLKQKDVQLLSLSKDLQSLQLQTKRNNLTLSQLSSKQALLKQALTIVQSESKKLIQALKQRYRSQEMYYQKYLQKEKECSKLLSVTAEIAEEMAVKERMLQHEREQIQKLKNQIQSAQRRAGERGQLPTDDNVLTVEYEKYEKLMRTNDHLMNKNREYLEMLSSKSTLSIQNQRLKNELRSISVTLTQINTQYGQFRADQEKETATLMARLTSVSEKRDVECGKVEKLMKELQEEREEKQKRMNAMYESLIEEKNVEIEGLRKKIESNAAIILAGGNVNKKEEEYKAQIEALMVQINSLKQNLPMSKQQQQPTQPSRPVPTDHSEPSGGFQKLTLITSQLQGIITQIRALFSERSSGSESLYQAFIEKYDQMQQQFFNLNTETSLIQQKARFISKELQRVKAHIVKSQNKVYKEKTELLALIRPCENAAGELVALSQTLSERDSQSFI